MWTLCGALCLHHLRGGSQEIMISMGQIRKPKRREIKWLAKSSKRVGEKMG